MANGQRNNSFFFLSIFTFLSTRLDVPTHLNSQFWIAIMTKPVLSHLMRQCCASDYGKKRFCSRIQFLTRVWAQVSLPLCAERCAPFVVVNEKQEEEKNTFDSYALRLRAFSKYLKELQEGKKNLSKISPAYLHEIVVCLPVMSHVIVVGFWAIALIPMPTFRCSFRRWPKCVALHSSIIHFGGCAIHNLSSSLLPSLVLAICEASPANCVSMQTNRYENNFAQRFCCGRISSDANPWRTYCTQNPADVALEKSLWIGQRANCVYGKDQEQD